MIPSQFRVLYREFLFRIVDLELLASRGDLTKLLGQLAALVAAISLMTAFGARRLAESDLAPSELVVSAWPMLHFLIATTMLFVGIFTVLSWDSTFPDRRDMLVLGPLPVPARTMFFAKLAALAVALALTVAIGNVFTGLSYPLVLGLRSDSGFGVLRSFVAYWLTMLAAGGFIFCSLLAMQGLAAQLLPRRYFLRLSAFLQLAAFCVLLSTYFLQPPLATPGLLSAPENWRLLAWLPSYWFLGLFHRLNGPQSSLLNPLAERAVIGVAMAATGAAAAFLLCYFRTLRKIVDEPDIVPGAAGASWPLRFGDTLRTAIVWFSVRTLLRSRQHRVILALYLGIGGAVALACARNSLYGRAGHPWTSVDGPLLIASIVVLFSAVVGVRVVFAMPIALRANWVFRVTTLRSPAAYLDALRRSLLFLGVVPVWAVSGPVFFTVWPPLQAIGHLLFLGVMGVTLADLCLHGLQKIPFTCSYLPGKANVHLAAGVCALVLVLLTDIFAKVEQTALRHPARYFVMLSVLVAISVWARRRTKTMALSPSTALQFEEAHPKDIVTLELHRDGVVPR